MEKQKSNTELDLKKERIKKANKELVERYPFLLPKDPNTGKFYEDEDYMWTFADDMPIGWYKAFGKKMFEEMKNELIRCNYLDEYQLLQVKEKFGALRVYDGGVPKDCNVWDIIRKYENISAHTCVNCGKTATKISLGWICPWCDDCAKEIGGQFRDLNEFEEEL